VSIKLATANGAVILSVTDNGSGFEATGTSGAERHGLRNIRDRARGMGAQLSIDSKPGAGTCITVDLPAKRRKGRGR
jgi:signal transduction histidine kinase